MASANDSDLRKDVKSAGFGIISLRTWREGGVRDKRVVGVLSVLAIVASVSFIAVHQSRSARRELGQVPRREWRQAPKVVDRSQHFLPIGPPIARLRVLVFLSFDGACLSCILEAKKVFKRIVKEHKGKVRFEFVNKDDWKKNREKMDRLAEAAKKENLPLSPEAEAWFLIGDKVKFKVEGKTVIFNTLPRPSDSTHRLLQKVVRLELGRLSGGCS